MYNWIDGRKFSDAKNLLVLNFVSKNSISFIRNAFELNNLNRLPVIKEEEGYVSEDELSEHLLRSNSLKKNCVSQKSICEKGTKNSNKNGEKLKETKPSRKLPPLVNINCMMNTDIKQTKFIWDTKFGKRLISGKDNNELSSSEIKKVRSSSAKCSSIKLGDINSPKIISKRKPIRIRTDKDGGGDKEDFNEINGTKRKSTDNKKEKKSLPKNKPNQDREIGKKNSPDSETKSVKFSELSSKEILDSSSSTFSSVSKNQRFLTECVQSILDGRSNQLNCENCNESFQNVEDLCKHKKEHEKKNETCLLCDKVFCNPNDFMQHLLTHEGVDKFSCKKCKKYFPSLKKYKEHCLENHFTPPSVISNNIQSSVESVKKWMPKLKCKRCKTEFDSEKQYEAHRRSHIKKDLAGAYLLSPKNN